MYCCSISPCIEVLYPLTGSIRLRSVKSKKTFIKRGDELSTARYNATKNPVIINYHYDILEKTASCNFSEKSDDSSGV